MKKIVALIIFIILSSGISTAEPQPVESPIIYFTAPSILARFNPDSGQISQINSGAAVNYAISHDKQSVAYWDADHLWLSPLPAWNPSLLYTQQGLNIIQATWMPDDSRILLSTSLNQPPTFAFDLIENKLETWNWSDCDKVVQNIDTFALGILCSNGDLSEQPKVFVWGGEATPFTLDKFRYLSRDSIFETDIDWGNQGETILYAENFSPEEFQYPNVAGRAFLNAAFQSLREPINILTQRAGTVEIIKLSPDGALVAALVHPSMLNIYDLYVFYTATGERLWHEPLSFRSTIARDIAWYPSGEKLAILKFNFPSSYLSIVDLASATMQDYALAQTDSSNVAVVMDDS